MAAQNNHDFMAFRDLVFNIVGKKIWSPFSIMTKVWPLKGWSVCVTLEF